LFPPAGKRKMFFRGVERPDFKIEIPKDFTPEKYISILKKVYACIRYNVYRQIRDIVRESENRSIS